MTKLDYLTLGVAGAVVVLMISPHFVEPACSTKMKEGYFYAMMINRFQLRHYSEFDEFAKELGDGKTTGIPRETDTYHFDVVVENKHAIALVQAKTKDLRSYRGDVWLNERTRNMMTMICVTHERGQQAQSANRGTLDCTRPCIPFTLKAD